MAEYLCPRCAQPLIPAGEILDADAPQPLPVLQCDRCVTRGKILGVPCDIALTFYVDESGQLVTRGGAIDPEVN